ncbi:MAG: hypothetical protein ACT4P3_17605 [Betaproteobacteria bacterium]
MPPRWRVPLLVLGFVSLAFGVAGGLSRLTPWLPVPGTAIALHGPLMVSAFFGTVISLERAAALDRPWAYAAPLAAGAGGVLLLSGFVMAGFVALAIAALVLLAASAAVMRRQPSLETATLLAGAGAWLAGNLMLFEGLAALPWWIAFFALTIGGERLELSRYLKRDPWTRRAFGLLAGVLLLSPVVPWLLGVALVLLAAWLFAFDLARVTVRQSGLPRYVAVCLLAGYFWLAVGGVLIAASYAYDAAMHAIFVGFVFSMVFGHAPVILPAVLRVRLPYSSFFYVPLFLLHASLAVRATLSTALGAWGNAAAIALFIATAALICVKGSAAPAR